MSKVELFENERATGYNLFIETWIPGYHWFLDQVPKLLSTTEPKDLLVAGCGTGNEIERFVNAPGHWQITGVDPSPQMIEQAKVKLQQYDNIQFVEGLVANMDSGKKYGAATLLLVLHFLEDDGSKLDLLKSISNRLLPGAPFVMLDITGNADWIKQNLEILRLLLPENLDSELMDERMNRIQNQLHPVSEERVAELLVEAGFELPQRFYQSAIYMGWITKKI